MAGLFADHMLKLQNKIRATVERQSGLRADTNREDGNRIVLAKVSWNSHDRPLTPVWPASGAMYRVAFSRVPTQSAFKR